MSPTATTVDLHDLVGRALDTPKAVAEQAQALLAAKPSRIERILLLQALGIGLRETGQVEQALTALSQAARLSVGSDDEADVRATYAGTLVWAGKRNRGLEEFRRARRVAVAGNSARVDVRYGLVLGWTDDLAQASTVLTKAARDLDSAGDTLWAARAWNNLGGVLAHGGQLEAADRALAEAAHRYAALGLTGEEASTHHLRGYERWRAGALPQALTLLDLATERFDEAGSVPTAVDVDRIRVLLSAGLLPDAAAAVEIALSRAASGDVASLQEMLVVAARTALANGAPDQAQLYAARARKLDRQVGNPDDTREAALIALQAKWGSGERGRRMAGSAEKLADAFSPHRVSERADAAMLAGRLRTKAADIDQARAWFSNAASLTSKEASPLGRVQSCLALGLLADLDGDGPGIQRAARRGLKVLDEYRAAFGSAELQARATSYGAELASLSVRDAVRRGRPVDVFTATERWRATVLATPPTRPAADPEQVADLADLRQVLAQLESDDSNPDLGGLQRQAHKLERQIRARTLRESGGGGDAPASKTTNKGLDLPALHRALAARDTTMVTLTRIDGHCHTVVVRDGQMHRVLAGSSADIDRVVDHILFLLRTCATGGAAMAERMLPALTEVGTELGRLTLGPAANLLGDSPVVLVPPARLHAAAWGMVPELSGRAFHVAASATTWLRAAQTTAPVAGQVVLVGGPGLASAGAELVPTRKLWPDATCLDAGFATTSAVLSALNGAALVHLAAHGTFRADNPMFSAFRLSDGPMYVHDLEGIDDAPYRLVLSACESGVGAHAGADELLGVTAALTRAGTAGVIAGVVPVHDGSTVWLSTVVHQQLRDGANLAEALLAARQEAHGEPLHAVTAAAFLAFGAA